MTMISKMSIITKKVAVIIRKVTVTIRKITNQMRVKRILMPIVLILTNYLIQKPTIM